MPLGVTCKSFAFKVQSYMLIIWTANPFRANGCISNFEKMMWQLGAGAYVALHNKAAKSKEQKKITRPQNGKRHPTTHAPPMEKRTFHCPSPLLKMEKRESIQS